jgi:hypothetical protein
MPILGLGLPFSKRVFGVEKSGDTKSDLVHRIDTRILYIKHTYIVVPK